MLSIVFLNFIVRLSPEMIEFLKEQIDEDCCISTGELVIKLREQFHLTVCMTTIDRVIHKFRYSVKRVTHRVIAGDSPANVQLRMEFANWLLDAVIEGKTLIWFDEVPFCVSMRRSYGRSAIGNRCEDRVQGRSRNITVMAAMYNGGMLHSEILAANGNTVTCAHYIDELAAARDRLGIANEEAVVLDYVGFHHSRDV